MNVLMMTLTPLKRVKSRSFSGEIGPFMQNRRDISGREKVKTRKVLHIGLQRCASRELARKIDVDKA